MAWRYQRVLVTGAGGFVGSHLVERLLNEGVDVTAFVRYTSSNGAGFLDVPGTRSKDIRMHKGDIRDQDAVRKAMERCEAVIHLAALVGIPYSFRNPREVVEVNTVGTLNVLTAARDLGLDRVVLASSSDVYGPLCYAPMDETHPKRPLSPYAASKIGADAIGLSFHAAYGLPVSIVRLFNTYGPRQSDRAVIPTIICQALTSQEIRLGNTAPTRDFTFISDTVEGFLRIGAADGAIGEEVQLGTGVEISIGDVAARIGGMLASKITIVPAPERVRQAGCEVTRLVSDNGKARRLAQWEPRVTLDEGLPRTIEWVRMRLADYAPGEYRV